MPKDLTPDQNVAVTMLLRSGKTIRDIAKFADLEPPAITKLARSLDLEPETEAQQRGKQLYGSTEALTFQQIAKQLSAEGFTGDDDAPMHHLTVASWVRNFGWPWGGADDGDYAPERAARPPVRSKYVIRMSQSVAEQVNSPTNVAKAAADAWLELSSDRTRIVQLAVIRGAASAGVTDLVKVKKALLDLHGEEIRTAKADD